MTKPVSNTTRGNPFVQGIACALAALIRQHDQPSVAADIMRGLGLAADDLRKARVELSDRIPIEKAMKQ